ncbi:virion structural protein [Pseudomonas phage D6]|nr:virion structural protein [Pseudomonas phage D6]
MAESNKKGMISGMDSLLSIGGDEFLEVIRMEADGTYKNYRLLVSKIRNNAGLSAYEIAVQNGYVGTVEQWLVSLEGKSAYQIAVDLGFVGDEAAFIASLKGDEGEVGESIYDVALRNGFIGTEADFLKTLVGKSAYQTAVEQGYVGTEAQWLLSLKGAKGDTGDAGKDGDIGPIGPDGKSAFEVWQSQPGNAGKTEAEYLAAQKGETGESAYEAAVKAGFVGTEEEYLKSLEGKSAFDIAKEEDPSLVDEAAFIASLKGETGKSAYEAAKDAGFVGSESDYLKSLEGASAYQLWLDAGNSGTEAQFLESLEGSDGTNGTNGTDGEDGKSAFEIAKELDPSLTTEAAWIASLKGDKGDDGTNGTDGVDGEDGQSAFELWLAQPGNAGKTEADFLNALKGADGDSAYQVAVDDGFVGTLQQWLESLVGEKGDIGQGLNVIDTISEEQFQEVVDLGESVVGDAYIVDTFLHVWNGTAWVKSNSMQGPEGRGLNYLGEWPTGAELPLDVNYKAGDTYVWRSSLWTLVEQPTRRWVDIGVPGPVGKSAYQSWLDIGNTGTESDFIASLKGTKGDRGTDGTNGTNGIDGEKGDDGDSAYAVAVANGFVGTEVQWLASLKGDEGDKGDPALAFEIKGRLTNESELPRPGTPAEAYYVGSDLYIWIVDETTPANSDYVNFGSLNGKSAYDIAVENGFVGTEDVWLASLKGTNGVDGTDGTDGRNLQVKGTQANLAAIQALPTPADQDAWVALDTGHLHIYATSAWIDAGPFRGEDGADGTDGVDGKSVYQIWLDAGNSGTEAEFLATLKGADGADGTDGTNGRNVVIKGSVANQAALPVGAAEQDAYTTLDTGILYMWISGAWVNLGQFKGDKGDKGETGNNGTDGTDGVDGAVGPAGPGLNIKGEVDLIANLPDPSTLEVGDAYYTQEDGRLYQVNDAGVYNPGIYLRGEKGEDGEQGIQGPAGTSITIMGSYATESALKAAHPTGTAGEGYLVGSDLYLYGINPVGGATEWFNAGPVRGPQGEQGIQGKTGLKGNTGNTGERGSLWLVLPNGVFEPTPDYGRAGDWAVNAQFDTFYKDNTSGWLQMGRLVAGDVNSPLPNLGKVVRLGSDWVKLPVDEVPSLVSGKVYGRQLKSGTTDEGEWVEIQFPAFPEPTADGKLYARSRANGQTNGAWTEVPAGIADLTVKDGKNYVRVYEAAGSAPIWKEIVIPSAGIGEAPTTAGKTYLRSGQNTNWVEYTGINAPADAKKYLRTATDWVAFDSYDTASTAVAAGTASATFNAATQQLMDITNTTGAVAKTINFTNLPGAGRATTLVLLVRGSVAALSFQINGTAVTASNLIWNGGVAPTYQAGINVVTFLVIGGASPVLIGAVGAQTAS